MPPCLQNPLQDKDLIYKIHNLIINPNTSRIRNLELFTLCRNIPKGQFYNINSNVNNCNNWKGKECHKVDIDELRRYEKTKYYKYLVKLNSVLKKTKDIRKKMQNFICINKKIKSF